MVLPDQKTSTLLDGAQTRIQRYFTTPGRHPYDEVDWEQRSASITDESGNAFFEQHDVEVPACWSPTAPHVVVSTRRARRARAFLLRCRQSEQHR